MAIKVTADASEAKAALDEGQSLLKSGVEIPLEVRNGLINLLKRGLKISGVENKTTFGTREIVVRLQLAEGFRELVAAVTRDRNVRIF